MDQGSPRFRFSRWGLSMLAIAVLAVTIVWASAGDDHSASPVPGSVDEVALADGELRAMVVAAMSSGGPSALQELVTIEVLHGLSDAEARATVEAHGGVVLGTVPGELILATIALADLESLEARDGIIFLRLPLEGLPESPSG